MTQAFHISLRIARIRAGWKQEYCASRLMVGVSTYRTWEAGRRKPIQAARDRLNALFPELNKIANPSGNA